MLTFRVLEHIHDVPREAWDALVDEGASPFVEHAWLACLEEAGCVGQGTGWLPRHLALYEGGELVAAAPAYLKTQSEGEFVFDWSWADLADRMGIDYYPKIVLAVPFTPATGHRVLSSPKRDRASIVAQFARVLRDLVRELGLSSAHVLFPGETEAREWQAAGWALRYGVQFHWANAEFRDFEAFLARLPQKKRTQIRRERGQLAKDGVTLETLKPAELTPEIAGTMYELYLTTVDKYFYGRRYLNRRFFELVATRFAHRLAWTVAKQEGRIIASAFNVKKADSLYGRYWGTFVELPFLHFNVCYYHGIDEAIREGLQTFNPGAGGEHKRVRGFLPTMTYSAHHIEHPRFRTIVESFLERERCAVSDHIAEERNDTTLT